MEAFSEDCVITHRYTEDLGPTGQGNQANLYDQPPKRALSGTTLIYLVAVFALVVVACNFRRPA